MTWRDGPPFTSFWHQHGRFKSWYLPFSLYYLFFVLLVAAFNTALDVTATLSLVQYILGMWFLLIHLYFGFLLAAYFHFVSFRYQPSSGTCAFPHCLQSLRMRVSCPTFCLHHRHAVPAFVRSALCTAHGSRCEVLLNLAVRFLVAVWTSGRYYFSPASFLFVGDQRLPTPSQPNGNRPRPSQPGRNRQSQATTSRAPPAPAASTGPRPGSRSSRRARRDSPPVHRYDTTHTVEPSTPRAGRYASRRSSRPSRPIAHAAAALASPRQTSLSAFILDSGANISFVHSLVYFVPGTYVEATEATRRRITTARHMSAVVTRGYGTVRLLLPSLDDDTHVTPFDIHNVHFCPDGNRCLLATDDMISADWTVVHPAGGGSYLERSGFRYALGERNGLYLVHAALFHDTEPDVNTSPAIAATASANVARASVDTSDWRPLQEHFDPVLLETGPLDTECFSDTDGDNRVLRGANVVAYTSQDSSLDHSWSGRKCWIHPPYLNPLLHQVLEKALRDFASDPANTVLVFMGPIWPTAIWYPFLKHFTQIRTYPTGTKLFTIPRRAHFPADVPSVDGARVLVGPTQWPVGVWVKSSTTVPSIDDNVLIHMRLGHPGASALNALRRLNTAVGTLQLSLPLAGVVSKVCQVCLQGKAVRPHAAPTARVAATSPWSMVFSDIHGPVSTASFTGHLYVLGFICDFSRYARLYFLRTHSAPAIIEAFTRFLRWVRQHKFTTSGMCFQSDNAGEFTGHELGSFFAANSITPRTSAAYRHENQAIIERLWRTLQDTSRTLLMAASLDIELWTLAFQHAVYLYNRLPHAHNGMVSPFQVIFRRRPDFSRLYVFGSTAYAYIDVDVRKRRADPKLDVRATQALYVGHDASSTAYILYNPTTKTVFHSGMVKIMENFDALGKVISMPNIPAPVFTLFADLTSKLGQAPLNLTNRRVVHGVTAVLAHRAYYHAADRETYGLLHVTTTSSDTLPIWARASSVLVATPSVFPLVFDYLRQAFRLAHDVNELYPIFAIVDVELDSAWYTGIVVGHDRRTTTTPYQVAFITDPKLPGGDGIQLLDVATDRIRQFSSLLGEVALVAYANSQTLSSYVDPRSWAHALTYPDAAEWKAATHAEMDSIRQMGVLKLLKNVPSGYNIIGTRFVYKLKRTATGAIDKYNARLVAQGFSQEYGVDYLDTFSPVTTLVTFRYVLILAVTFGLTCYHLDVKTAFLNSVLSEELYIRLPIGFAIDNCQYARLIKSLYGLKQGARDWYLLSHRTLLAFDKRIRRSLVDPCLYFLVDIENALIVLISVHVDDYVIATSQPKFYQKFLTFMKSKFTVADLGPLTFALGVHINWAKTGDKVTLSQERDIKDLMIKHGLVNSKSAATPMEIRVPDAKPNEMNSPSLPDVPYRSLVGSLMWIARNSRPDILYAMGYYSRFNNCYTIELFNGLKRVLRFLHTTIELGLSFVRPAGVTLRSLASDFHVDISVYTDSDWAGDATTRRSVSGGVVLLYGNILSVVSVLQKTVALSSAEAELMGIVESMKDGIHAINLAKDICPARLPVKVYYDNIGAGHMASNPVNNKRSKHIDIRYKFTHDYIDNGIFELVFVESAGNLADIFTKSQPSTTANPRIEILMHGRVRQARP
jgi:transposase InsO family protein